MVVLVAACAYFNTFHNAKKYYAEGVTMKEQGQQTQAKAKFDKAVEKSARVIQRWPRFSTAARPKPGPGVGPGLELVPAEAGSRPDARRRKAGVGLALTGEGGGVP
jgi:hypothetical protein